MKTIAELRREYETTLASIAHAGFEAALVTATFDNLLIEGPLCFNNFAYALRELLRHVFHRLGPDESVRQCVWYVPDSTSKTGVTRAHRAKYMIQGGLSDHFAQRQLRVDVSSVNADLTKAFNVLSSFTHVGPDTFALNSKDVIVNAEQCLAATKYLIEHIAECRRRVLDGLEKAVDQHLLKKVISETIVELDELATHHLVEEVNVDSVVVVDIGPTDVTLEIDGNVGVELQYGSSSDVRNDIGAVMSDSFPFTASMCVRFKRPLGSEATISDLKVDTSDWYGDEV